MGYRILKDYNIQLADSPNWNKVRVAFDGETWKSVGAEYNNIGIYNQVFDAYELVGNTGITVLAKSAILDTKYYQALDHIFNNVGVGDPAWTDLVANYQTASGANVFITIAGPSTQYGVPGSGHFDSLGGVFPHVGSDQLINVNAYSKKTEESISVEAFVLTVAHELNHRKYGQHVGDSINLSPLGKPIDDLLQIYTLQDVINDPTYQGGYDLARYLLKDILANSTQSTLASKLMLKSEFAIDNYVDNAEASYENKLAYGRHAQVMSKRRAALRYVFEEIKTNPTGTYAVNYSAADKQTLLDAMEKEGLIVGSDDNSDGIVTIDEFAQTKILDSADLEAYQNLNNSYSGALPAPQMLADSTNLLTAEEIIAAARQFANVQGVYGLIGEQVGSSVGSLLASKVDLGEVGDVASDVISSTVFGQIGSAFGKALAGNAPIGVQVDFFERLEGQLEDHFLAPGVFKEALQGATVGTISSLLTAELGDALGLDGVAGEAFGVVGNTLLNGVLNHASGYLPGLESAFSGFSDSVFGAGDPGAGNPAGGLANLPGAVGAFLGAKLGSLVVSPTTQAGAVLSSLGSSVGGILAGKIIGKVAGTFLNALVPGVGAFVGFVLGALIGNLFGKKKKPKIPTADADTELNFTSGYYELGAVTSADSGNEDLVTDMANAAADTLNGFIDVMSGIGLGAEVINTVSPTQKYGHTGNQIYVKIDEDGNGSYSAAETHNVGGADEAVDIGALYAIRETEIAGGNLYMKRAVLASTADNLASFSGDLKVAEDYATYKLNQETIDAAIAAPYESLSATDKTFYENNEANFLAVQRSDHQAMTTAQTNWYNANQAQVDSITDTLNSVSQFAAGWIITLQRAAELGLNKSALSDFHGGMKGFVDSLKGIVSVPINYEDIAITGLNGGQDIGFVHDLNHSGTYNLGIGEEILFTETNFTKPIGNADGTAGYTRAWETAYTTTGNDLVIMNSANDDIDVKAGDDIVAATSVDNDIEGGAGNDWIDGRAGDDTLYGGNDDDVLLGRSGNDFLYGGNGNDHLVSGQGTDRLYGGGGNDTLVMSVGAGGWLQDNHGGDDTYIVSGDTSWGGWVYDGNGNNTTDYGNDTISYERIGWGLDVDLSEEKPSNWTSSSWWLQSHDDTRYLVARSMDGNNTDFAYGVHKVENITGTAFADKLWGDTKDNVLRGGAGDDNLHGRQGNDSLEGGAGADILDGGGGLDVLSYAHSLGGVDVSTQFDANLGGPHAFGGDASGDTIQGNFWTLVGSEYSDVLEGNHANNWVIGGGGDDYIIATRGTDNYYGGDGFDTVDFGNHSLSSGLTINAFDGGQTSGYKNAVHNAAGNITLDGIEHVVGTDGVDIITFGAGDNVLEGGAGNDTLYGGAGNDIYFVEIGGGHDQIHESGNAGHDTIMVGYEEGLSWDDVFIGATTGNPYTANLEFQVNGVAIATANNSASDKRELVGVDAIDIGGTGAVDIWYVYDAQVTGNATSNNDTITGSDDPSLLQGLGGNDTIYSVVGASGTGVEDSANFLHGGTGNDQIWASNGDDQYIFDRGSGVDTYRDSGGSDHIQFGPGVSADELIFEVVGNDLYIGIVDESNPNYTASEVDDRIQIVGGGKRKIGGDFLPNLIEYITVENVNIDLRTLDLEWAIQPNTDPIANYTGNDNRTAQVGIPLTINLLANDYDSDGDSLSFTIDYSTVPSDLSVIKVSSTSVDVDIGVTQSRSFKYILSDGNGGTDEQWVTITGDGNPPQIRVSDATLNPDLPDTPDILSSDLKLLSPIALDLAGDGLDLVSVYSSNTVVLGGDGTLSRVGWLSEEDGFLALDRNSDGLIDNVSELSFRQDMEGATSDLEALAAYDSNEDGVLDALDERFGDFKIWQDRDQNGVSTRGELMTLTEAGIVSLSLRTSSTGNVLGDFASSTKLNTLEFTLENGETSSAYDVALSTSVIAEGRENEAVTFGVAEDGVLDSIDVSRLDVILGETTPRPLTTMEKLQEMVTDSDWGQASGMRSRLSAIMSDETETERERSYDLDLGVSQEELITRFTASRVPVDLPGRETAAGQTSALAPEQNLLDSIGTSSTSKVSMSGEKRPAADARALDQFAQAMAGFGAKPAFAGLSPIVGDEKTRSSFVASQSWKSARQQSILA